MTFEFKMTAPGVAKSAVFGFDLPDDDEIDLANTTVSDSSAGITTANIAVSDEELTVGDGRYAETYPAGSALILDVTTTSAALGGASRAIRRLYFDVQTLGGWRKRFVRPVVLESRTEHTGPVGVLPVALASRGRFNIRDYGAKCDGATDDLAAWQAAILAAEEDDGVVVHPGGVSLISSGLALAENSTAGIEGVPGSMLKATGTWSALEPMIDIPSEEDTAGSNFGVIRDLQIDGNNVASIGLRAYSVQRHFENLDVNRCKLVGVYVDGAQNNTFISVNSQRNGTGGYVRGDTISGGVTAPFPACNICLDSGAANNNFYRCQFSCSNPPPATEAKYNAVICHSGLQTYNGNQTPFANTFFGCQFERSPDNAAGTLLHSNGRWNRLEQCLFSVFGALPIIHITRLENGGSGSERPSAALVLDNCCFTGESGEANFGVKVFKTSSITPNAPAALLIAPVVENVDKLISTDTDSSVFYVPPMVGAPTTFAEDATGSKTALAVAQSHMPVFAGLPSGEPLGGTTNQGPTCFDSTYNLQHIYSGGQYRRSQFEPVAMTAIAYDGGGAAAVNAANGGYQRLTISDGTNLTLAVPSNAAFGMQLTIEFYRNYASSPGSITFSASTGGYLTAGSFTAPASNGKSKAITFRFDGTNWREISRSSDVG